MRAQQVREFHTTYKQPMHNGTITTTLDHMSDERIAMRLGLIIEEVKELLRDGFGVRANVTFSAATEGNHYVEDLLGALKFTGQRDIVAIADALGDISYVVDGFAIETGIPLDEVIDEIHSSNMSKLDENGQPIYRGDGKVLKGPNFREPDIESVIFKKEI